MADLGITMKKTGYETGTVAVIAGVATLLSIKLRDLGVDIPEAVMISVLAGVASGLTRGISNLIKNRDK